MTLLSEGGFGPDGKKLGELTNEELRDELRRRRQKSAPKSEVARPPLRRVKQYLANLELSPGATWPEVQRAYNRLLDRYHPDKHDDHPERHETALELTESLTRAYQALRKYFGRE